MEEARHDAVVKALSVRPANPSDFPGLRDLHAAAIMAAASYTDDEKRSWATGLSAEAYGVAQQEGESFQVAVLPDGELCGFCSVKDATIVGLYIHPNHQDHGIGSALLKSGEAMIRANGHSTGELESSLNAVPFYLAKGWEVVRNAYRSTRGGKELRVLLMRKTLSGTNTA
ncbi:MAG: GNAT family N-acetyltransferase [Hyphomicrobiales bacterium]